MAVHSICMRCGTFCVPDTKIPGSILISMLLAIFGCMPGIIYEIWRQTHPYEYCGNCKRQSMVAISSELGAKHFEPHYKVKPSPDLIAEDLTSRRKQAIQRTTWEIAIWLGVIVVTIFVLHVTHSVSSVK